MTKQTSKTSMKYQKCWEKISLKGWRRRCKIWAVKTISILSVAITPPPTPATYKTWWNWLNKDTNNVRYMIGMIRSLPISLQTTALYISSDLVKYKRHPSYLIQVLSSSPNSMDSRRHAHWDLIQVVINTSLYLGIGTQY